MSYTPISSGEVAAGKPTTSTLLTKVKDNFTDHESRISGLETGTVTVYPPIIMSVSGLYGTIPSSEWTGYLKTTANFNLLITGARLIIDTAGTAGTTDIDIKVKHAGSYNSIFTTRPSVAYTAGDEAVSTNAVLNSAYTTVLAGDLLRLDIMGVQTNPTIVSGPKNFFVRIDYTKV